MLDALIWLNSRSGNTAYTRHINEMNYIYSELGYIWKDLHYNINELTRFFNVYREGRRKHIEVHHKNYERIGDELEEDLAVVCFICHTIITENAWIHGLDEAWKIAVEHSKTTLDKFDKLYEAETKLDKIIAKRKARRKAKEVRKWLKPPRSQDES